MVLVLAHFPIFVMPNVWPRPGTGVFGSAKYPVFRRGEISLMHTLVLLGRLTVRSLFR